MTKRYVGVGIVAALVGGAACFVACSSDPDATSGTTSDGGGGTEAAADTSTSSPADSGVDSAEPAEAGADTGTCAAYTGALPNDAGAQCHDLASTATAVAVIADPGTIPVGTGGTLGDGLYHLTEVRAYAGSPVPAGMMLKYALLVAGDTTYIVDDNGPSTVRRTTKKNPDGGAAIIVCETKADNNAGASTATATCSSFTTYDANSKFSAKFVKQ